MGVEYIGSYVSSDSVLLFLCATRYAEQEGDNEDMKGGMGRRGGDRVLYETEVGNVFCL